MAFVLAALACVVTIIYFFINGGGIYGDRWIVIAVLGVVMFLAARKT